MTTPPVTAVLGLGSNLGDRQSAIGAALDALDARDGVRVLAVSALYETPPWGMTDQPAFLNAAAKVETEHSPRALLDAALGVERMLGRERRERWGPRSIDIDILLYGESRVEEEGLSIPHPRLAERAFALLPLLDVMPEAELAGRRAAEWLGDIDGSGIVRAAPPGWWKAGRA